eukprot:jgi/Chlat1/5259/Chrsp33S05096
MLGNVERYLLTPIVLRLARKFIKNADDAAGSDFRASISGGSVIFRNFELNLDEVLQNFPGRVVRTFARELHIKIPWTRLASEPIEVVLDTVECVFAATPDEVTASTSNASASPETVLKGRLDDPPLATGSDLSDAAAVVGWIGGLVQRALSNITLRVNNLVVKYTANDAIATLSCEAVQVFSAGSDWEPAFVDTDTYLLQKVLQIKNITLCLDKSQSGDSIQFLDPLLRAPLVRARVTHRVANQTDAQQTNVTVDVESIDASVSDVQIQLLKGIISLLIPQATKSAGAAAGTEAEEEPAKILDKPAEQEAAEAASPPVVAQVVQAGGWALGAVWDFLANTDAANAASLQQDGVTGSQSPGAKDRGEFSVKPAEVAVVVSLQRGSIVCCRIEVSNEAAESPEHGGASTSFSSLSEQAASKSRDDEDSSTEPGQQLLRSSSAGRSSAHEPSSARAETSELDALELAAQFGSLAPFASTLRESKRSLRLRSLRSRSVRFMELQWASAAAEASIIGDALVEVNMHLFKLDLFQHSAAGDKSTVFGMYPVGRDMPAVGAQWQRSLRNSFPSSEDASLTVTADSSSFATTLDVGRVTAAYSSGLVAAILDFAGVHSTASPMEEVAEPTTEEQTDPTAAEAHTETVSEPLIMSKLGDVSLAIATLRVCVLSAPFGQPAPSTAALLEVLSLAGSVQTSAAPSGQELPSGCSTASIVATVQLAVIPEWLPDASHATIHADHVIAPAATLQASISDTRSTAALSGSQRAASDLKASVSLDALTLTVKKRHVENFLRLYHAIAMEHGFNQVSVMALAVEYTTKSNSTPAFVAVQLETAVAKLLTTRLSLLPAVPSATAVQARIHLPLTFHHNDRDVPPVKDSAPLRVDAQLGIVKAELSVSTLLCLLDFKLQQFSPPSGTPPVLTKTASFAPSIHCRITVINSSAVLLADHAKLQELNEPPLPSADGASTSFARRSDQFAAVQLCVQQLQISICSGSAVSSSVAAVASTQEVLAALSVTLPELDVLLGYTDKTRSLQDGHAQLRQLPNSAVSVRKGVLNLSIPRKATVSTSPLGLDCTVVAITVTLSKMQHQLLLALPPLPELPEMDASATHPSQPTPHAFSLRIEQLAIALDTWRSFGCARPALQDLTMQTSTVAVAMQRLHVSSQLTLRPLEQHRQRLVDAFGARPVETQGQNSARSWLAVQIGLGEMVATVARPASPQLQESVVKHLLLKPAPTAGDRPFITAEWRACVQGGVGAELTADVAGFNSQLDVQVFEEAVTLATLWDVKTLSSRKQQELPLKSRPPSINGRVVLGHSSLHVMSEFPTATEPAAYTQATGILLDVEDTVAILHDTLEDDARRWVGAQSPSLSSGELMAAAALMQAPAADSLAFVQRFDVSLISGSLFTTSSAFQAPALTISHTDVHISGSVVGIPLPVSLTLDSQFLDVRLSQQHISAITQLGSVLEALYTQACKLRQDFPATSVDGDDLRLGLFKKSQEPAEVPNRLEISWGTSPGTSDRLKSDGWIAWGYPYEREVYSVVIEGISVEQPGHQPAVPVAFQLSQFDASAGTYVDAAPLAVCTAPGCTVVIDAGGQVAATWRLSWAMASGGLTNSSSGALHSQFSVPSVLQRVHVNPFGGQYPAWGTNPPLVAPFVFSARLANVKATILQQDSEAFVEQFAARGSNVCIGLHSWSDNTTAVAVAGVLSAEYADTATLVHEPFVSALSIAVCVETNLDKATMVQTFAAPATGVHEGAHHEGRIEATLSPLPRLPPSSSGLCISGHISGTAEIKLSEGALRAVHRAITSVAVLQHPIAQIDHLVHNSIKAAVLRRTADVGTNERLSLSAGSHVLYSWHTPPILHAEKRPLLRACFGTERNGDDGGVDSIWCEPFAIDGKASIRRVVMLPAAASMAVSVNVSVVGRHISVVIKPGYEIVNRTAHLLVVRYRGLVPPAAPVQKSWASPSRLSPSQPGNYCTPGELLFALPAAGESGAHQRDVVCIEGGPIKDHHPSVCIMFGEGKEWSQPIDVVNNASATSLLSVPVAGSEQPYQFWCQTACNTAASGQVVITLWPLFFLSNCMPQNLFYRTSGLSPARSYTSKVAAGAEAALHVATMASEHIELLLAEDAGHPEAGPTNAEHTQTAAWTEGLLLAAPSSTLEGTRSSTKRMPEVGQLLPMTLSGHAGKAACVVLADSYQPGVPSVRLSLVPQTLLHNETGSTLCILTSANDKYEIPAKATVAIHIASAERSKVILRIGRLSHSAKPSGPAVWSNAINPESQLQHVSLIEEIGAHSHVEKLLVWSENSKLQRSPLKAIYQIRHICVVPWALVSNLSEYSLLLATAHGSPVDAQVVTPGTRALPLAAWSGPTDWLTAQDDESNALTNLLVSLAPAGELAYPSSSSDLKQALWTGPISLPAAARQHQRQRLFLQPQSSSNAIVMVSLRVVVSKGQLHVVVFRDQQPPYLFRNNTPHDLLVAPEGVNKLAAFIRAEQTVEHDWPAGTLRRAGIGDDDPVGAGNEDEAMLDLHRPAVHPKLRFQLPDGEWSDPIGMGRVMKRTMLSLVCGKQTVVVAVAVSCKGATSEIVLESHEMLALEAKSLAAHSSPNLTVTVRIDCLAISVWDDDHAKLMDAQEPTPSAAEIALLTVNGMQVVYLQRHELPLVTGAGITTHSIKAQVDALQLDSFADGGDHAYVLAFEPSQWPAADNTPALSLSCLACLPADIPPATASFDSLWLRKLTVHTQSIVVNVNDPLLQLVERIRLKVGDYVVNEDPNHGSYWASAWTAIAPPVFLADTSLMVASRLYLEELDIGAAACLFNIHISGPVSIDTHRSPLTLSALQLRGLLYRPPVLLHGLLAHYVAEAILNAPGMLGSLELLFNPTGLVQSVGAGIRDLVSMPMQGMQRSPAAFIYGIGQGSASFARHMTTWSLTSVAGFSSSVARILERAVEGRPQGGSPARTRANPQHVTQALATGLSGLGQGVVDGVSGLVMQPIRGAATSGGSGLIMGMGKGVLGLFTRPVSGALDMVAQASQGILSSTGIATAYQLHKQRRPGRTRQSDAASLRAHSMVPRYQRQVLDQSGDSYVSHTTVDTAHVELIYGDRGPRTLIRPVLLLSARALWLLEHGGCTAVARFPLDGLAVHEDGRTCSLLIASATTSMWEQHSGDSSSKSAQAHVETGALAWATWLPSLRRSLQLRKSRTR